MSNYIQVKPTSTTNNIAIPIGSLPIVSIGAYGLRKIFESYTNNKSIQVTNGSQFWDIGFTNGNFDEFSYRTIAMSNTLTVSKIYDQSGVGRDLTFGTTKPVISFALSRPSILWSENILNNVLASSTIPISVSNPCIFSVYDHVYESGYSYLYDFGGNKFIARILASGIELFNGSLITFNDVWKRGIVQRTIQFNTGNDTVRYNGSSIPGSGNAGDTPTSNLQITLGNHSSGAYGLTGFWQETIFYNAVVGSTERDLIEKNQKDYYTKADVLITDGDSLTFGYSMTPPTRYSYPSQLQRIIDGWNLYNIAVSGQTIAQMISSFPTKVVPKLNVNAKNIIILNGGYNDAFQGGNSSLIISRIQSYIALVNAQKTTYNIVFAIQPMPISDFATQPVNYATTRNDVNTWLSNNRNLFDIYIDFSNDINIGTGASTSNSTYFLPDKIHLTQAGYAIVANYCKSLLMSTPISHNYK